MARLESILERLSDAQLLLHLHDLIQRDHNLEAELVAHLGEVDARRLYLEQACSSMFNYCVDVLHFAEGVAYERIAVARAARKFPVVLAALEKGDLHLTGACLLAPHLAEGSAGEWVAIARHVTAREIKQRIVDRRPKPDVKTSVRKTPTPRPAAESDEALPSATNQFESTAEATPPTAIAPAAATFSGPLPTTNTAAAPAPHKSLTPAVVAAAPHARGSQHTAIAAAASHSVGSKPPAMSPPPAPTPPPASENDKARCQPLGAERYCVRFMADRVVHGQIQELQALLRPLIPDGDVAKILARAIAALLEQVKKRKIGACSSPRSPRASTGSDSRSMAASRHIPAAIRRQVWARDGGRCTYVSRQGRQCGAGEFLEFHHQMPWAHCREHAPSNIHLRCRSHNQYEAELAFGSKHMAAYRTSPSAGRVVEEAEPAARGRHESRQDLHPVRAPLADP